MKQEQIYNVINNSDLSYFEKREARRLLDRVFRTNETQNFRDKLEVLKELRDKYEEIKLRYCDEEKLNSVLSGIIKDYEARIRRNDALLDDSPGFDDYTPITFEKFLGSLCKKGTKIEKTEDGKIVFTPDDPDILERILKHAEDDGCGYAPKGFQEVFTSYQDRGDMNIYLWT